jgi:hypothetical protein
MDVIDPDNFIGERPFSGRSLLSGRVSEQDDAEPEGTEDQ